MASGIAISAQLETSPPTAEPQPALPRQLADFDTYVESVRKRFEVPSIAVAVVKDGEIVFERGWGERELGKSPVDAQTLFAIASNTKAFTATALNLLAEDGTLSMQDRISDTCRGCRRRTRMSPATCAFVI